MVSSRKHSIREVTGKRDWRIIGPQSNVQHVYVHQTNVSVPSGVPNVGVTRITQGKHIRMLSGVNNDGPL